MEISYDSEGRILACSVIGGALSGENVMSIADEKVPPDFLETFALGGYLVRKDKLEKSRSFEQPAADLPDELSRILAETVEIHRGLAPKRPKKRPSKRRE